MSRTTRLIAALALSAGVEVAAVPATAAPATVPVASFGHHSPRIVQQWANAWTTMNPVAMSNLFDKNGVYIDHAFQASFTGPAGAKLWVELTADSINPAKVAVHDTIAQGNNIAVTWTFSGTFTGDSPFTPPYTAEGKSFAVPATSIITLRHGKILKIDDYYNLADILRQVGLPAGAYTPPSAP
ncbi:ester cyclase [Kribbella antibiotica]|nr:nuclear transport factor 2 family protein [Kribbella antibiotica]